MFNAFLMLYLVLKKSNLSYDEPSTTDTNTKQNLKQIQQTKDDGEGTPLILLECSNTTIEIKITKILCDPIKFLRFLKVLP